MSTADNEREALEATIGETLETRVEDVIDLDLNDPSENQIFWILVGQVVDAVLAAGWRRQGPVTERVDRDNEAHERAFAAVRASGALCTGGSLVEVASNARVWRAVEAAIGALEAARNA